MKKILTLLMFALFWIGSNVHLRAENGGLVTVNVYAKGEDLSKRGGGTVDVTVWGVRNIKSAGLGKVNYNETPDYDGPDVQASAEGKGHKETLGWKGIKYLLKAAPDAENFYFDGWTTSDDLTANRVSSELEYTNTDSYRASNHILDFYAIFMKYRWGYLYPCIVYAVGGGKVSIDGEEANASTYITYTSLTPKKKGVSIEYKYYAHETEDVEFVGWYDNEYGNGEPLGENLQYASSYVPTSIDKENPSVVPQAIYAVFRKKYVGYNQPYNYKIHGNGEISVDNESWSNENILEHVSYDYATTKNGPVEFRVNYYAKASDGDYDFDGWYDEEGIRIVDGEKYEIINNESTKTYTCTYKYESEETELGDVKEPPTLTAKFVPNNYYYCDFAKVMVAEGCQNMGYVYVDKLESTGSPEYTNTVWQIGNSENIKASQYAYKYYANAIDGYAFVKWVVKTNELSEGECVEVEKELSKNPEYVYTVSYEDVCDWHTGDNNAYTPKVVYAVFQSSRPYYHGRATVGVARTSEEGSVYVSKEQLEIEDIQESNWFSPTYDDDNLNNDIYASNEESNYSNPEIIKLPENVYQYTYHYYATPKDPTKSAFYGWTLMQEGANVSSDNNPYTITYEDAKDNPNEVRAPLTLYAVFRSFYHTLPRIISIGSGQVKIEGHTDDFVDGGINDINLIQTPAPANENYYDYAYTLIANPMSGSDFIGWSLTSDGKNIVSTNEQYVASGRSYSTLSSDPHRLTYYAIFDSDVKFKHVDRMIYYQDVDNGYINDANVIVEVEKTAKISVNLSGDYASEFSISTETITNLQTPFYMDASQGIIPLRLSYIGALSDAIGKDVKIEISAFDNNGNKIAANDKIIVIERLPVITFLPTDGRAEYTVSHTNGSGVSYEFKKSSTQSVKIEVENESMSYLHLNLEVETIQDGLLFFGWKLQDKEGKTTYLPYVDSEANYKTEVTHHFEEPVIVSPEFIPHDLAQFIIKAHPTVPYYNLHDAIEQAKLGGYGDEKIIVVVKNGRLPKSEKSYDIPNGVTLLVPGVGPGDTWKSTDYKCVTQNLNESDFHLELNDNAKPFGDSYSYKFGVYKKLEVEEGTIINVKRGGYICVYAKSILQNELLQAFPFTYGHIELGDKAQINIENGGNLYAWGFITNKSGTQVTDFNYKEVGRINAQQGSNVYELFGFRDFRGGTKMVDFVELSTVQQLALLGMGVVGSDNLKNSIFSGYKHETFPILQYYVQNIETPITFVAGAKETLMSAVCPGGTSRPFSIDFIGSGSGLFQWGNSSATITKYYDSSVDRIRYIIEDQKNSEQPSINIGCIVLEVNATVTWLTIRSDSYVLPVQNNMDIVLKSAVCNIPKGVDVALMPGANLTIDKNSILRNNAQLYVYDNYEFVFPEKDGHEGFIVGYVGKNNGCIYQFPHRPNGVVGRGSPNQSHNSSTDATIVVDGLLENTTTGYLITTEHGAEIKSNGGGSIILKNFGTKYTGSANSSDIVRNQSVFQYSHYDATHNGDVVYSRGFHAIPLATYDGKFYPRLLNSGSDATTKQFCEAITAGTYYYCGEAWDKYDTQPSECSRQNPNEDYTPRFTINDVDLTAYVGKSDKIVELSELVTQANPNIEDWSPVVWSATFTGNDANLFGFAKVNDVYQLSFTPASKGEKMAVMVLKAVYTYNNKKYVHREVVDLKALALDLAENTLTFNDLTKLYAGQGETRLFTTMSENANPIALTIFDKKGDEVSFELSEFGINGNTIAPALEIDEALIDTFTIRAVQEEDPTNQIKGADISTTLIINPLVVWNWSELYYPTENVNPITMMNGTDDWTLTKKLKTIDDFDTDNEKEEIAQKEQERFEAQRQGYSIVEFTGDAPSEYKAVIADQIAGVYTVYFEFTYKDVTREFMSTIYRDPRRVTVNVNEALTFRAVTIGAHKGISFDDETDKVTIQTEQNATNTWTLNFLGIPDKLGFTPNGDNPWQIEESPNGKSWATTFAWERLTNGQPFEFSLMPSTRYLRISYGANTTSNSIGTLTNVYITKLEGVKFNPSKLYMPATIGENKNVAVTYVSDVPVTIASDKTTDEAYKFSAEPNQLLLDKGGKPYAATDVLITNLRVEEPELANVHMTSSYATDQLPIQTYGPQALPIVLASDMPAERFYYVTPYYHNVTWDNDTRTITINNKIASAQPYMIFHFDGTAEYISFNHNTDIKGDWIFEWSKNGKDWNDCKLVPNTGSGYIKQSFNNLNGETPSYIRVTYNSLSREKVDITNLMIISGSAAYTDPNKLTVWYNSNTDNFKDFHLKTINIDSPITVSVVENNEEGEGENNEGETEEESHFTIQYDGIDPTTEFTYTGSDVIGSNVSGDLPITVYYDGARASAYATIVVQQEGEVLATVDVTGLRKGVTAGHEWYTGVAAGYDIQNKSDFEGRERKLLSLENTFSSDGEALFDYLYLFGETSTTDGTKYITDANTRLGSNAKTPCYIYKKNTNGTGYDFLELVENANTSVKVTANRTKTIVEGENEKTVSELALVEEGVSEILKVYISGFCPFTSTGYTKLDEGIFYFQGGADDHVHVYLEHCFLYSRAKTLDGHHFEDRSDGNSFTENYARGSGAVLVFECEDKENFDFGETTYDDFEDKEGYEGYLESERRNAESIERGGDELYDSWLMWVKPGYKEEKSIPFKVTIHTRGNNLLKSHYGCFLESVAGRAFQASSPVQIHLKSAAYEQASFTELNFDDIWPTGTNTTERTNGKLKLQKRVNNAPSIDMGNDKTVVNFNGGQIELQNAQIVSYNYRSSLAICPRSGYFAQFKLAVGMGTDGVGGMVNFNDGTTTVKEMYVSPKYADCYLLDKDKDGNYITATIKGEECYRTSCIRAPRHVYVRGGSHGMMRACKNASSQGGAPNDENGVPVGLYLYPKVKQGDARGGFSGPNSVGLVTPNNNEAGGVPDGYNVESVTPNTNGTVPDENATPEQVSEAQKDDYLNFWFNEDEEKSVNPEVDKDISFWKTCMTSIKAEYGGYGGEVGGVTSIKMFEDGTQKEIVKHLLYCEIDQNISGVICDGNFSAYVKNPAYVGDTYVPIKPTYVGGEYQNYITNENIYQVENKVYYIVPAVADVWNAFTAPFDVANIYVMETYSEEHLDRLTWDKNYVKEYLDLDSPQSRDYVLELQARQNAYFASFFAVTIALDQDKDFATMYDEYMDWARLQDIQAGFWSEEKDLAKYKSEGPRGMRILTPYNGSNWSTADFYLNKNTGNWEIDEDGNFTTSWKQVGDANDEGVLLEQGQTYSMLFPYCTGCGTLVDDDDDGTGSKKLSFAPSDRDFYDYWTGKFLIFESVDGSHQIHGSKFVNNKMETLLTEGTDNTAMIMGNSSFAEFKTKPIQQIYNYQEDIKHSSFYSSYDEKVDIKDEDFHVPVKPTGSFLVLNVPNQENVASVSMQGIVTYRGPQDTPTGGMTPTVGGGRDMFITGITGGINVAVASPQMVYVVTSTGSILYSGYVDTSVDVKIPTNGIYIVRGEREVQKILY